MLSGFESKHALRCMYSVSKRILRTISGKVSRRFAVMIDPSLDYMRKIDIIDHANRIGNVNNWPEPVQGDSHVNMGKRLLILM